MDRKWLEMEEDWADKHVPLVNEREGWEDAPVTRWCHECQRNKPIHDFRWRPPRYEDEEKGELCGIDHHLTEKARSLGLIEDTEHVYVLWYMSLDRGATIHKRLGGNLKSASRALTEIARGIR